MNLLNVLLMAPSGEGGGWFNMIFVGLFFIIFYFFMIRPQSKKAKDQKSFIDEIQKGDRVVTIGGIHGKVLKVDETTILVEVDSNTKLRVEKSVVSMDMTKTAADDRSN